MGRAMGAMGRAWLGVGLASRRGCCDIGRNWCWRMGRKMDGIIVSLSTGILIDMQSTDDGMISQLNFTSITLQTNK